MHDLFIAKEIIQEIIANAKKNNLKKISKVLIELGNNKYNHGDHTHTETIHPENLKFNLKLIAKNTVAEQAEFMIKKTNAPDILIKEMEGE